MFRHLKTESHQLMDTINGGRVMSVFSSQMSIFYGFTHTHTHTHTHTIERKNLTDTDTLKNPYR